MPSLALLNESITTHSADCLHASLVYHILQMAAMSHCGRVAKRVSSAKATAPLASRDTATVLRNVRIVIQSIRTMRLPTFTVRSVLN
jgi:hypothetical protein